MKRFFLALFSWALVFTVHAQSQTQPMPYVVIDGFTTDIKHLVIGPKHIKEVSVLKGTSAIERLGNKAEHGAVMITTKPGTTLLQLNQILDRYNIPEADRKLRVCINKTLVRQPELIVAEASGIQAVEITTERYWQHTEDANSSERFINIKATSATK